MRKWLWVVGILVLTLLVADNLGVGNRPMTTGGALFDTDTVHKGETLWTDTKSVPNHEGMDGNISVAFGLDLIADLSGTDSVVCEVLYQESWDGGVTYLRTYSAGTIRKDADFDTAVNLSLTPPPTFRVGFYGACSDSDTFDVSDVMINNPVH